MADGQAFVDALPDSVKVGPFVYAIRKLDRLSDEDNWGECDSGTLTISLKRAQPSPVFALDSLMHEVGHAIWKLFALGDENKEETAVAALATGWVMVLTDNPALAKCLYDATRAL